MIDPAIEMVDLEPDGFGIVNALMSDYFRQARVELHVLHDGGRIARAVHTRDGIVTSLLGRPIDASEHGAGSLRSETGVARVILVDRARLAERTDALAAAADASTQDEMLVRSRRAFLGPGVLAVPPIDLDWWDRWAAHLRALGDDYVALIAAYDDTACVFTLVATVTAGRVRRVTSLTPVLGDSRPPLTEARDLVTAARTFGPVRLAVIADVGLFAEALSRRSIEPLRARAIVCAGLPEEPEH